MDMNSNRIRDDVEAVLFPQRKRVEADNAILGSNVFSIYCDANVIGQKIFDDLWKKRGQFVYAEQPRMSFFSDDRNTERTGFLSDVYGCSAVFALMNRMVSKIRDTTKRGKKDQIVWKEESIVLTSEQKEEFLAHIYAILDDLHVYGCNLYPYVSGKINDQLFPQGRPYMGAMTWTLSLLVNAWRAHVNGLLKLSDDRFNQIKGYIKEIIYNIIDSAVTDTSDNSIGLEYNEATGECKLTKSTPYGWGYTIGCSSPSLFFTYSVLEAYSDFDDVVLSVIDRSLSKEDKSAYQLAAEELVTYINDDEKYGKVDKWRLMCEAVSDRVWDDYKDVLKTGFVDDTFYEFDLVRNGDGTTSYVQKPIGIIDKDTILKSNSSNALFNSMYLIFILFYGYANKRKGRSEEESNEIVETMNVTLRNVQKTYNELNKLGKGYLVDSYIVNFKQLHEVDGDKYMRILSSERLLDCTIVPMIVKANNMIAFHIEKYPIKEMRELFLDLFKEIDKQAWLWDGSRYDVKITERYIEAIADFYDYYNEYEKTYAKFDDEKQAAVDVVTKRYESQIKETEAKHQAEIERLQAELTGAKKNAATEYAVETAMRALIDARAARTVNSMFENIAAYNAGNKDVSTLSEFEKQMAALIPKLLLSYLDKKIVSRELNKSAAADKTVKVHSELNAALDELINVLGVKSNAVSSFIRTELKDKKD